MTDSRIKLVKLLLDAMLAVNSLPAYEANKSKIERDLASLIALSQNTERA